MMADRKLLVLLAVLLLGVNAQYHSGLTGPCDAQGLIVGSVHYGENAGGMPLDVPCFANTDSGAFWYSVAVQPGYTLKLSTCLEYTNFATVVSIYTGSCQSVICQTYKAPTGTEICVDLDWVSTGEYAYVAISGVGNSTGEFALTSDLQQTGAAPSSCSAPISLPFIDVSPIAVFGDTIFGSSHTDCNGVSNNAIWYTFYVSGASANVNAYGCYQVPQEMYFSLYSDSCSSLRCVSNSTGCSLFTSVASGWYYLAVSVAANSPRTDFSFSFYATNLAPDYTCAAPYYADLTTPYSGYYYGTLLGQSSISNDPCNVATGPAFWFEVSANAGTNFTMSTCGYGFLPVPTLITVYTGSSCSSLSCQVKGSNCPNSYYQGSVAVFENVPSHFYVVVSGVDGQEGDFSLYFYQGTQQYWGEGENGWYEELQN